MLSKKPVILHIPGHWRCRERGRRRSSTTVNVAANTVSEVSAFLQPLAPVTGSGSLSVSSTPAGANVFLDNNFIGVTPFTLPGVAVGNHVVTIKLEGYEECSASTQVNAGATSTVSTFLQPGTVPSPTQKSGMVPVFSVIAVIAVGIFALRSRNRLF